MPRPHFEEEQRPKTWPVALNASAMLREQPQPDARVDKVLGGILSCREKVMQDPPKIPVEPRVNRNAKAHLRAFRDRGGQKVPREPTKEDLARCTAELEIFR